MYKCVDIYKITCTKTNEVMYVGKSYFIKDRIRHHFNKKPKSNIGIWVRESINKGFTPNIEIIESCYAETAVFIENYWICYYKDKGMCEINKLYYRFTVESIAKRLNNIKYRYILTDNEKECYSYLLNIPMSDILLMAKGKYLKKHANLTDDSVLITNYELNESDVQRQQNTTVPR